MKKTHALFLSMTLLAILAISGIFVFAGFTQMDDFVATAVAQTLGAFSLKTAEAREFATIHAFTSNKSLGSLRQTIAALEKALTGTPVSAEAEAMALVETMMSQTMAAINGQSKATPQPTSGPPVWNPPAGTLGTTATPADSCNQFRFVADVTIPDGMVMNPGQAFTKTWRIQNSGSCSWNQRYYLTFLKGAQMGPGTVYLDRTVAPGETVDLSLAMTAPMAAGSYRGHFAMFAPDGERFGTASGIQDGVWVDIRVGGGGGSSGAPGCQVGRIWAERQASDESGFYKFTFFVELTNSGTDVWRADTLDFYHTAQGEEFLDALTYDLPKDVPPGETYVFSGITGWFNTNYPPLPSGWAFGAGGKEICSFSLMFTN